MRQINERKQAMQLRHLDALQSYVAAGERCDMRFDPPLHELQDGTTLSVELDREAFLRFLPLGF